MRILSKMIIVFCVICNTVFARGSVKEANLQLAENGLTDYKIYQSVDASEPEKFAAQEFIRYFQKSCGIHLKVVKDFPKDGKVIAIGISKTVISSLLRCFSLSFLFASDSLLNLSFNASDLR